MKNVVITESGDGFGLTLAKYYLAFNCNVTISALRESFFGQARRELTAYAGKVTFISCDVSSAVELQNLWRRSVEKWETIDVWINNIPLGFEEKRMHDFTEAELLAVFGKYIFGTMNGIKIAVNAMQKQGRGTVINIDWHGREAEEKYFSTIRNMVGGAITTFMNGYQREHEKTDRKKIVVAQLDPQINKILGKDVYLATVVARSINSAVTGEYITCSAEDEKIYLKELEKTQKKLGKR